MVTPEEQYDFLSQTDSTWPGAVAEMGKLLSIGCVPDHVYNDGRTALAVAVTNGCMDKTRLVVESISSFKYSDPDRYIRAMAEGRKPMNQINRGMRKLFYFPSLRS